MKIFLGADHAGYELKNQLLEHLHHKGYEVFDVGAKALDEDDDYPLYAYQVATKVLGEPEDEGRGILICGSGQGMSIAANRIHGIRAALAWSPETAAASRHDDDANILALPARYIKSEEAFDIVEKWLETEFAGDEKYRRRIDELGDLRG